MFAAEQDQTKQELPESICQPRHVRLFILAPSAALSACNALESVKPFSEGKIAKPMSAKG